jgi:hypothetical protein
VGQRPELERRLTVTATVPAAGWRRWGPWVGAAGLLIALWFYGFVGLVAPWWVVPLMLLLWVALAVIAWQSAESRPGVSLAMPVVAMALWFAIVYAGGAWWGWTA